MNQTEFVMLVKQMRETQKKYFRTRDRIVLLESKELERKVDKEIDSFCDVPDTNVGSKEVSE